jgi:hypothetical protein
MCLMKKNIRYPAKLDKLFLLFYLIFAHVTSKIKINFNKLELKF